MCCVRAGRSHPDRSHAVTLHFTCWRGEPFKRQEPPAWGGAQQERPYGKSRLNSPRLGTFGSHRSALVRAALRGEPGRFSESRQELSSWRTPEAGRIRAVDRICRAKVSLPVYEPDLGVPNFSGARQGGARRMTVH